MQKIEFTRTISTSLNLLKNLVMKFEAKCELACENDLDTIRSKWCSIPRNLDVYLSVYQKYTVKKISSLALKPINIRWIRTGCQSY